ncbi:MAG: hypothetical protein Q4P28_05110 [Tissierellia bacterium]|nr:hypothetical protein [Tissierellia bacterium]
MTDRDCPMGWRAGMEKLMDLLKMNEESIEIKRTNRGVKIYYGDEVHDIQGYSFNYKGRISDIAKKEKWSKKDLYTLVYFLRIFSWEHSIFPIGKILFSQYENGGLHLYGHYHQIMNYLNHRKKKYTLDGEIPKNSLLIYSDDFIWSSQWWNCRLENQLMVYIGKSYREMDYLLGINTINICNLS